MKALMKTQSCVTVTGKEDHATANPGMLELQEMGINEEMFETYKRMFKREGSKKNLTNHSFTRRRKRKSKEKGENL